MDQKTVKAIVLQTVADAAGLDSTVINPDADLVDDLHMDSLAVFEVVVDLESRFNLRIPDEVIDQLRSIERITAYIERELDTNSHA
ncbi:MAG: acyl carrier protein [Bacillota bacterium]|nr:acyl carrier protein [Bacillota bacterium]